MALLRSWQRDGFCVIKTQRWNLKPKESWHICEKLTAQASEFCIIIFSITLNHNKWRHALILAKSRTDFECAPIWFVWTLLRGCGLCFRQSTIFPRSKTATPAIKPSKIWHNVTSTMNFCQRIGKLNAHYNKCRARSRKARGAVALCELDNDSLVPWNSSNNTPQHSLVRATDCRTSPMPHIWWG